VYNMHYKVLLAVLMVIMIGSGTIQSAVPKQYNTANIHAKEIVSVTDCNILNRSEGLLKVKVAILYEPITRYRPFNRTIEDIIRVLNETKADFVFRCFWRWYPCPETPEQLSTEFLREKCRYVGYYYEHLKEVISTIKASLPDIILCGAIPAQILHSRKVWNPITGEVIEYPKTWEMALDPKKWNIPIEKEKFQCWFAKTHFWVSRDLNWHDYDPTKVDAYFPDITNPKFQELLLSWAYKQIDCGVDAIWIDMLFAQVHFLAKMTGDENHIAVRESLKAVCRIVDAIHEYGLLKGRYIYVGSWPLSLKSPPEVPKLDFVTISPTSREILYMDLNETRYDTIIKVVKNLWGEVPIFAFIDWAATTRTPLGVFSQNLTREQQCEFLRMADEFFQSKGINFIYPVHGGFLGINATIKAFGKFNTYDSQAPEFDTYKTILELAYKKALKGASSEENPWKEGIVNVIDLRGSNLETRLMVLSLQGIVNRRKPSIYVLWESAHLRPTASERWLEYYRSKGWIRGYRIIDMYDAIEKYKHYLKGIVVYDPELPATINLAVSLAGVEDLIIAHPDMLERLMELGLEVKYDLRNKFKDRIDAHRWQLENVFPRCSRDLINLFPTMKGVAIYRVSIIDYVIASKGCSIGLSVGSDSSLIGEYYSKMNRFAIAIGYPEDPKWERAWVSLTSKYGLLNLLATAFSPNFSFHSKVPAKKEYRQEHRLEVKVDPGKIYIAFAVSDLGLNVMQDFYYEMWLSEGRGEVPVSWWLDPIVTDFCPGIVQYYYETKTPNDYFFSAHVGGRIRPSDFPYLEEYLHRGQKYLDRCSLKVVAFSNHNKKDERVFRLYSRILKVEGFSFGFGPEFEEDYWFVDDKVWIVPRYMGDPKTLYDALVKYIDSKSKRPLFIIAGIGLWYYPKFKDLIGIKRKLEEKYGDQVVFCRVDELIGAIKHYKLLEEESARKAGRLRLLLPIVIVIVVLLLVSFYFKIKKYKT